VGREERVKGWYGRMTDVLPASAPWYDKLLIDIVLEPGPYLGWLAVIFVPLFSIAMYTTLVMLNGEVKRLGKKSRKKAKKDN
jgi:hypothetical protein